MLRPSCYLCLHISRLCTLPWRGKQVDKSCANWSINWGINRRPKKYNIHLCPQCSGVAWIHSHAWRLTAWTKIHQWLSGQSSDWSKMQQFTWWTLPPGRRVRWSIESNTEYRSGVRLFFVLQERLSGYYSLGALTVAHFQARKVLTATALHYLLHLSATCGILAGPSGNQPR